MKGSAPKSPATGSHAERTKNAKPNWRSETEDREISSAAISATTMKTDTAVPMITARKLRSARREGVGSAGAARLKMRFGACFSEGARPENLNLGIAATPQDYSAHIKGLLKPRRNNKDRKSTRLNS